jgi:alpha-N-arabinofuranosidase
MSKHNCRSLQLFVALVLGNGLAFAQFQETAPTPQTVTLSVDTTKVAQYRIPRTLFGTFLEPIGNSTYNGLWAEILVNPSLEENLWDTEHIAAMVREEPQLVRSSQLALPLPWEPLDSAQGNRYEPHWGGAPNSWRTLEILGLPGQSTGIRQKVYLPVPREEQYVGSFYARHVSGPVDLTVQLRKRNSAQAMAQAQVVAASLDWTKYTFSLQLPKHALEPLEPADFVLQVAGDERVDVDNLLLFPADAIGGLDPEIVSLAREMHTPLLRFGGNFTSAYHWKDGIGPQDRRVSMLNIAWGIPEYNTFGTDELLEFCKLIHAEPQIALNLGSGTPEEAAEWVKYVDDRFAGGHGGLRWELGNELWGSWNLGWPTLKQLPGRTLAFSRAIHNADPKAQLIATGGDPDWFHDWNAAQLGTPAHTFDALSTHFVVTTDQTKLDHPTADFIAEATFALPVELGRRLRQAREQIESAPSFAHDSHLAFTEWLFVADRWDAPKYSNMGGAIAAASFLNMLMKNADIVPVSDMTGLLEFGGIWKKRGQVYAAPAYYAFQMFSAADATRPVQINADSGQYAVQNGVTRLPDIAGVPYLDTFAALNESGTTLTLFTVNRDLQRDIRTQIQIVGFRPTAEASVQTLESGSLYDENSEEAPRHVVPSTSSTRTLGDGLLFVFPRRSVTVLTLIRQ